MNSVERVVVTVTIMIHRLGVLVTEAECSGTATTNIIIQVVCFWNSIAVPQGASIDTAQATLYHPQCTPPWVQPNLDL